MKLSKKDKDAFVEMYDLYFDDIYRFVYFKIGQKEEAEDICSAVFLKAWSYAQDNNLGEYKSLKSFLYKIARNTVIDHYRKKSTQVEKLSIDSTGSNIDIIDQSQDVHKKIEIASEYQEIEKNLKKLKDEYKDMIVMRYLNEMSIKEIALALDKTPGNVRVSLFRALNALKSLLEEKK